MAAVCLPPSPKATAADAVLEMTAAVADLLQQQQQQQPQQKRAVVALDECPVTSRGKTSYRSHIQLLENAHTNLASFILENAGSDVFSSRTAIVDGATGTHYTYSKVHDMVKKTAAGLAAWGVKPKDVVLLLSPNLPEFPIVYLAVVYLGAVVAPSNPLNTNADIAKQVAQASVKFAVTVPELLSKFGDDCDLPTILIGDEAKCKDSIKTSSRIRLLSDICKDGADVVTDVKPYTKCHPDDTCTLLFSSGTTGLSKAVELSHRNFMSAIAAYNTLEPGASTSDTDVCLAIIPMYHVYGLGIVMLATLERGASVVTMERYSLPAMLKYVEDYKITVATLVPPILVSLVKSADVVAKYDLSSLKIIATGAASLREDTMKAIALMFPHAIMRQGYGMTEAPLVSFSVVANERRQWGSVGPLVPGIEVRITHIESGNALPPLATGEIWVRGPQIMKGYLNNPETTAASLDSEKWLHTGDLGYMNTNGYLFIVDRLKEMIKYKAHQVAPGELEAVLLKHPRIVDAAVVPYPDEEAGELPLAYVVKREGTDLSEKEVMSFVSKMVAPYKKVRMVEFIKAIPKSTAGKILRKELIARHQQ